MIAAQSGVIVSRSAARLVLRTTDKLMNTVEFKLIDVLL